MLPSPYTPGETPTVLVGRDAQLERAQADLSLMATYGRFLGRVQVDIGSRGVGKTSLLKAVRDAAGQAGAVVVWVTARGDESLVASLTHALLRALEEIGVDAGPRTPLRERFQSVSVELGGRFSGCEPRSGSGKKHTPPASITESAHIANSTPHTLLLMVRCTMRARAPSSKYTSYSFCKPVVVSAGGRRRTNSP